MLLSKIRCWRTALGAQISRPHRRMSMATSIKTTTTTSSKMATWRWQSTRSYASAATVVPTHAKSNPKWTISITDSCVAQINHLKKAEKNQNTKLRIIVEGGGCNGFLIKFDLDTKPLKKDDVVFEKAGSQVVIDEISMEYLKDCTVDFEEELSRSAFVVTENPNAKTNCGCKISFGV